MHQEKVLVLQHVAREGHDDEDVKFIGVYSSRGSAESTVARLVLQPGFADHPDGFEIDAYELDEDHWLEGFVSMSFEQSQAEPVIAALAESRGQ